MAHKLTQGLENELLQIKRDFAEKQKSIQEYEALKGRIEYLAKYIETERIQNKAFYTGVLKNYTDREKMVKEFGFVSLEKFEL